MAEPFLAEIRIFPFGYAPKGWALCNGALLQIQQNTALYSLIGITFGGDGRTNFNLPDLRGRVPVHPGPQTSRTDAVAYGQKGGAEIVAVTTAQLPAHTHPVYANAANGDMVTPVTSTAGFIWAEADLPDSTLQNAYSPATVPIATMDPTIISNEGGGVAHNNIQPSQPVNYCIALTGYYPPRP